MGQGTALAFSTARLAKTYRFANIIMMSSTCKERGKTHVLDKRQHLQGDEHM